jgi:hypothetical protein
LTFSTFLEGLIANTSTKYVLIDSDIAKPSAGPCSDEPTKEIVAFGFFLYGHQECLKYYNKQSFVF